VVILIHDACSAITRIQITACFGQNLIRACSLAVSADRKEICTIGSLIGRRWGSENTRGKDGDQREEKTV